MTCLCRKQDDLPVKWVQDDMPWRAPRPVVRSRSVKVSTVEAGNCADRWMVDKQKPSNTDYFCLRYEEIAVTITLLIEKKVYLYIYMSLHVLLLLLSDIFLAGHVYSSCW